MLEVKGLTVKLGNFSLKNITLDVQDGEYFVFLGPTGSGKTMLLESLAGLKPVESGRIIINGRDVTQLNLENRNIGFAYQDYVLFRHLSVRDNISYGLMWRNRKKREIEDAIDRVVELLGIASLLDKRPLSLSGGESQKICLARALAMKPDLLLLDEPLSAVDPQTRESFEKKLKEIHSVLKLTTIHVTHNFEEAMAVGDRIAVIGDGHIHQTGAPSQIFRHPKSEFVARFLMSRNIFEGEIQEGIFSVDGIKMAVDAKLPGRQNASIRPEDILISKEPCGSGSLNQFKGTIKGIIDRGAVLYISVNVPPEFICLVLRPSYEELGLKENQEVYISFKTSAVNVFGAKEETYDRAL